LQLASFYRRAPVVAIASSLVLAALAVPAPARAGTPTTTTLSSSAANPAVESTITLTATVSPVPDGGEVTLSRDGVFVESQPVDSTSGTAVFSIFVDEPRASTFVATYSGSEAFDGSASSEVKVDSRYTTSVALTSNRNPAVQHEQTVTFTATVSASVQPTGVVKFKDGTTVLATVNLVGDKATYKSSTLAVGTRTIRAEFTATASHRGSTSAPLSQKITADTTVKGTVSPAQYGTFYPIVDRYRDTIRFSGSRTESASVSVKIYNSSNVLVRTLTVAAKTGAYSVTWNGKNTAGTLVAAGKYRVVTSLTDGRRNVLTVTQYATLNKAKVTVTVCGGVMNGPGNDNLNPNGEYVVLCNTGTIPASLADWHLTDEGPNWTYWFPAHTIPAGGRVTLYTGKGTNTSTKLYWGYGRAVWNDTGDCANVFNYNGTRVARRCF
jgi:flagellar hook assembly protein FlgD